MSSIIKRALMCTCQYMQETTQISETIPKDKMGKNNKSTSNHKRTSQKNHKKNTIDPDKNKKLTKV